MIHCRSPSDTPRSRWADGSAMFTIVASKTIISWARQMKTSAAQRRRPAGAGPAGERSTVAGDGSKGASINRMSVLFGDRRTVAPACQERTFVIDWRHAESQRRAPRTPQAADPGRRPALLHPQGLPPDVHAGRL